MTDFHPPEGINFRPSETLPATALSSSLAAIASFLQHRNLYETLNYYHDWWQHDGLHFHRGQIDFHGLFAIVQTPRSLMAAMPGDDHVRLGIAPADATWYLRFILDWSPDDIRLEGDFDLTLAPDVADAFRLEVVSSFAFSIIEEDAHDYFHRIQI